jgi:hypothetical protein
MTSSSPSVDAELMLHAEHLGIVEVQEIRRLPIRSEILLHDLKAHAGRISITLGSVIDRSDKAIRTRDNGGD